MEDQEVVARLLLRHWDPLQIEGMDAAPDAEYLHEAARVLAVMRSGGAESEIAEVLRSSGLDSLPSRDSEAARAVVLWWAQASP